MDNDILKKFINCGLMEDTRQNVVAKTLLTDIISRASGEAVTDSIYESSTAAYDTNKSLPYLAVGYFEGKGGHLLVFNESCTEVAFELNTDSLSRFVPSPEVKQLLQACVARIKFQAYAIERHIVDLFTSDLHYGTEDHIEEEFDTHLQEFLKDLDHIASRPVLEAFPLKLDYKGRILSYLIEYEGNMDNIHPIHAE